MPPEIATPEAPELQQQALPDTEPTVSAEQPEAAAAAAEETRPKKQRDRMAEMGRRLAEAERLALATASENQRLKESIDKFNEFLSVQQQAAFEQRLAELPPEQQTIELSRQLRQLQMRRAAAEPQAQPVQDTTAEALRILSDANALFGLDGSDALTGTEPELHYSRHATRESFLRTAYKLAQDRAEGNDTQEETVAAAKKSASQTPKQTDSVADLIGREMDKLRQELGIGRPNRATPSGQGAVDVEVADLNRIAGRNDLGPKARIEALKKAAQA